MTQIAIALDLGTSGFRGQAIELDTGEIICTAITTRHPLPGANVIDHLHFALEMGVEAAQGIVVEAIKLIESGWADELCDELWVVHASPEQQVARLVATRGMSRDEAWQRVHGQPSQERKEARADRIIDNRGTLEETRRQVEEAWAGLMSRVEEDG